MRLWVKISEYRTSHHDVVLLQYADDLMLATPTKEVCLKATGDLLQTLGTLGYRASAKKAQIARQEVIHLGYKIKQEQRWLTQAMKETTLWIPEPTTPRQVREFLGTQLGTAGYGLWGPWRRPVAGLSKRLDPVAAGWPPCLCIIVATALLVHDADKLTYGQSLLVYTPHAIEGILKQPPGK